MSTEPIGGRPEICVISEGLPQAERIWPDRSAYDVQFANNLSLTSVLLAVEAFYNAGHPLTVSENGNGLLVYGVKGLVLAQKLFRPKVPHTASVEFHESVRGTALWASIYVRGQHDDQSLAAVVDKIHTQLGIEQDRLRITTTPRGINVTGLFGLEFADRPAWCTSLAAAGITARLMV